MKKILLILAMLGATISPAIAKNKTAGKKKPATTKTTQKKTKAKAKRATLSAEERNLLLDIAQTTTDQASLTIALDELFNAEQRTSTQKNISRYSEKVIDPDISCIIADMKFDGYSIKILEFGEITKSYFKGHEKLYGKGKIWENLWKNLAEHHIPVWHIAEKKLSTQAQQTYAFETFKKFGGRNTKAISDITGAPQHDKKNDDHERYIKNHKGILMAHQAHLIRRSHHNQKEPGYIMFNRAVQPFVGNKLRTSELFNSDNLKQYKPSWKSYYKKYTPGLAAKIANDFAQDILVIKPLNAANGWGIIITHKQDLDSHLKIILQKNTAAIDQIHDASYSYWASDHNKEFLVESYEQSKFITIGNEEFDGTMRMVMLLTYQDEKIDIKFLGGYWKLPKLSLAQDGSLTDKHKSKVDTKRAITSAKISPEDTIIVETILQDIMPDIYKKMLMAR